MSEYDPKTLLPEPSYLIKFKSTTSWKSNDVIYGLGYKGNSRFGLFEMKSVVEDRNRSACLTFRVSESDTPSWQDCLDEMEDKPPVGQPYMMVDRPYTMAEMVAVGYEKGFFMDEKGLKSMSRKTTPGPGAKLVKTNARVEDDLNIRQQIVKTAEEDAAKLKNIARNMIDPSTLSQGLSLLTNQEQTSTDGEGEAIQVELASEEVTTGARDESDKTPDDLKSMTEALQH